MKPETFVQLHAATGDTILYTSVSRINDHEVKMEGLDERNNTWSAIGVRKFGEIVRVRSERMVRETVSE